MSDTTEASDVAFGFEVSTGFLARMALSFIGFVGTIVFARLLGSTEFGGYYLLYSVTLFGVRPVQGFAHAAKKRLSEHGSDAERILGGHLLVLFGVTTVAVVLARLFERELVAYSGLSEAALLVTVLLFTLTLVESVTTILEGTGRVGISNSIDLVGSIFTFPLQLAFVLVGFGAAGMAYGLSVASLATALVGLFVLGVRPSLPTRETLRSLWEFGRFSALSTTVAKVLFRVDILLLGAFFTPAVAGAYEVALKLSIPAILIATVAGNGLMARVSNFASKGDTRSLVLDVNNTLSVSSVFAVPMLFGAVALQGDVVVTLYGSDFRQGSVFLVWVMVYQLARSFSSPMLRTLEGLDHPDLNLWIGIGVLALNVVLGVALLSVVGPVGVVLATVVAELIRYGLATYFVKREVPHVVVIPRMVGEQIAAGAIMFGVVAAASGYVPVHSWIDLVILVGLGAVVYGVSLLGISEGHRTMARNVAAQFRRADPT